MRVAGKWSAIWVIRGEENAPRIVSQQENFQKEVNILFGLERNCRWLVPKTRHV